MGFKFAVITYRLLFALLIIAAVAWQLSDRAFSPGFSFVNFFSFFTILSNILLAVVFLASAWVGKRGRWVSSLRGAAVLYMTVTGLVYAALLRPYNADGGLVIPWIDLVLHQLMPLVALLDWLLVPPRNKISKKMILSWLIFPLAFLIYSLIRGHFANWYPYPFLNPSDQGYWTVSAYTAGIALAFLLLGVVVGWTGNHIRAYAKLHPKHYPHFGDSKTAAVDWRGAKKSRLTILLAVILIVIGVGGLGAGWRMWRSYQIETFQQISQTDLSDIQKQTAIYEGQFFEAQANYLISNNQKIDNQVRRTVDDVFQPCRRDGLSRRYEPAFSCQADFKILYETDAYLAVMYNFLSNGHATQTSLLYDLKTGEQVKLASLFKPDSGYLDVLSGAVRASLQAQFGDYYNADATLKTSAEKNSTADAQNFANFFLTDDEKLFVYYQPGQVAAQDLGVVRAEVDPNKIFGILNPQTVDSFFPKLKAQKEEERKKAEAAMRAAKEAEVARQHARSLVAPNRSNVNCSQMKCISLTLDDGPGGYTNQALDMLASRNAVATFFVLGRSAKNHPAILKRIINEKSEVANHSWSHANLTGLSNQSVIAEVENTNRAILEATGSYPKLFRPPYGAYSSRVVSYIGMPIAMWSIDTNDWKRPGSNAVCQRAVGSASPGSVILIHDIHASSVAAIPCIVDELQRQGYVMVTMSELFGIDSSNVQSYSGHVLRRR